MDTDQSTRRPDDPRKDDPRKDEPGGLTGLVVDLLRLLRFYSRLPIPVLPGEGNPHAPPRFGRAAGLVPVAALLITIPAVLALLAGWLLWLPTTLVALIGLAVQALVTGALHEDGLADTADGLFGGRDREHRLAIMRDSRIGSYGALALVMVVLARIEALSALLDRQGIEAAALAFVTAATVSRAAALIPHAALPPARSEGRAEGVGQPGTSALIVALGLSLILAFLLLRGFDGGRVVAALGAALGAAALMSALARAKLGGHTGDILGATQQLAETAMLVLLTASIHR